ncbi:hypothetical protein SERLADRAFT_413419 [Serpula lacrymans var. lacrymans S7.9]|uniref:DUF6534 domain-containing protein n=1 Tax=Serpula lacrymans var. lacrymans (strain S7.9) TaxID=578457 RepID=F8NLF2_SERL9|nr:uncharacterized protein SERLADRAFT_413419 [Serpula lacrymans var. lacrymans S7.9]EGO28569.1 hypothetical protein SERLADRAFT_413419 [Serpula lacrymans var. lacrymans S7.9]
MYLSGTGSSRRPNFLCMEDKVASIGTMIGGIHVKYFVDLDKVKSMSLIWLFGSVVTDAIITVTLVCHLRQSRTGFPSTDHVIACVIRLTVQTGLLTTTCALGVVMSYLIAGTTTMHLSFGLPLSKLYTTTLVSSLNARNVWNPEGYTVEKSVSQTGVRPQPRHTRMFNATSGINVNGPPAIEENSTLDHHEMELELPVKSWNKISFLV